MSFEHIKKDFVGTATGIANFGQQSAGIIAPTVMGYMISLFNGSYQAIFWLVISMSMLTLSIALTVKTESTE